MRWRKTGKRKTKWPRVTWRRSVEKEIAENGMKQDPAIVAGQAALEFLGDSLVS